MSFSARIALLTVALASLSACARAQTTVGRNDPVYTWRGTVRSGALLTIRNFNGPIDVRPSNGSTAELRAEKRARGGASVEDVTFDVETGRDGDVTICSAYRDQGCDRDGGRRRDRWNRDDDDERGRSVTVAMTVLVPRGTRVRLATGNGDMTIERVGGDVQASTGNGRVRVEGTDGPVKVNTGNGDVDVQGARSSVNVSTGNGAVNVTTSEGPVEARSGNGNIDVRMSSLRAREDMSFHTGSGSVRITLPSGYNGELDASTGNGELSTDFELKIRGRMNPRHVRATIGNGGPTLRLTTGNGRLEVRRGS